MTNRKVDYDRIVELYNNGMSSVGISREMGIGTTTVFRALSKFGVKARSNKFNSRRYKVNHDFFDNIDTEEKAYILGFSYADGYVTKSGDAKYFGIAISTEDSEILDKINRAMDSNYEIKNYMTKENGKYKSTPYSRLLIRSDKIFDDLSKHGVIPKKTNIITRPKIRYDLIRHFIRGYMDGDGSIIMTKKLEFTFSLLGTDDLLLYISEYLLENDLISSINKLGKRKDEQIVSYIRYGGNIQAQKILDHLYQDSTIFLDRKYNRYIKLKEVNSPSWKGFHD
ncbi:hypothetical protein LC76P1_00069 [Lysinibacillus phage LC76P1]|nr:hypothetical protein LC76P1_00069 [Lysinibacillus phage LC76P1]